MRSISCAKCIGVATDTAEFEPVECGFVIKSVPEDVDPFLWDLEG